MFQSNNPCSSFFSAIVPLFAICYKFLCNLIHEGIEDDQCMSSKDGGETAKKGVYSDEDKDSLSYQQAIRSSFIFNILNSF